MSGAPDVTLWLKGTPGNPYRPSNGDEGMAFHAEFCDQCEHDRQWRESETNPCFIMGSSMAFDADEGGYPKEWHYDARGYPVCSAFEVEAEQPEKGKEDEPAPFKHDPRTMTLFPGDDS